MPRMTLGEMAKVVEKYMDMGGGGGQGGLRVGRHTGKVCREVYARG